MKLTLNTMERDGAEIKFASGSEIQYRVDGLPSGQHAYIARFNESWRILHSDDERRGWRGDYSSVEEALAALQAERWH